MEPRERDETAENTAQLKAEINSGRTGDKVGGFDPASAPLGTDAEAGGAPPETGEVAEAAARERAGGRRSAKANGAEPSLAPDGAGSRGPAALPVLAGIAAGGLLVLALLLLL